MGDLQRFHAHRVRGQLGDELAWSWRGVIGVGRRLLGDAQVELQLAGELLRLAVDKLEGVRRWQTEQRRVARDAGGIEQPAVVVGVGPLRIGVAHQREGGLRMARVVAVDRRRVAVRGVAEEAGGIDLRERAHGRQPIGVAPVDGPGLVLLRHAVAVGVTDAVDMIEAEHVGDLVRRRAALGLGPGDAVAGPSREAAGGDRRVDQADHRGVVEQSADLGDRRHPDVRLVAPGRGRRVDIAVQTEVPQSRLGGLRAGEHGLRVDLEVDRGQREVFDEVLVGEHGEGEQHVVDIFDHRAGAGAVVEGDEPDRRVLGVDGPQSR